MEFKSVNDILDFAIKNEEGAFEFYTGLSEKMENHAMAKVFTDFANEELGHKKKLLDIKEGKLLLSDEARVMDLKIADYIDVEVDLTKPSYQDALIIAMRREKKAFKMYTDLASKTQNEGLKNMLLAIAQEEAKHKLWFETEYDEFILKDN